MVRHDGVEILDTAYKYLPDIIVLDLMLPSLDGRSIITELKKTDTTCNIPIIVITAKSNRSERDELLKMGVNVYINKPFDPNELIRAVSRLTNNNKERQTS